MKLQISVYISYETDEMIQFWLSHILGVFSNSKYELEFLFLTERESSFLQDVQRTRENVFILLTDSTIPIFIKLQQLVDFFLERDSCDYFIKTDIDTVFLGFKNPSELDFIEGQWSRYTINHQKARWSYMPEQWRKKNFKFSTVSFIDSVHGGFMMFHKIICQNIEPLFWRENIVWPKEYLTYSNPESPEAKRMVGEEQMFGWYLKQLGYRIQTAELITGVDKAGKYYTTYRAKPEQIKKTTLIFHPVKNLEVWGQVENRLKELGRL